MIPYKDENPTHHTPWVTYSLIFLNVAAWVLIQGMGTYPVLGESICRYGAIPGAILGASLDWAGTTGYCPPASQGWFNVISSMFMHGGWLHLIGNMWFLWIFADNIEDALRPFRFIVFYLLGGIVAVAAQAVADPGSMIPMVGASGAIGGIMGAYARLYPRVAVHIAIILGFFVIQRTIPAFWMLGIWLALQVIGALATMGTGQQGGTAFWAHIGGFVAGYLLIRVFHNSRSLPGREV